MHLLSYLKGHLIDIHHGYQTQDVAKAIAAKNFALALSLRDPEFEDCLHAFRSTTRLNETYRVPQSQRMRIAIIQ